MSFSRGVLLFHEGGDGVGVKPKLQSKKPVYIAIDLKSYYASVECIERDLNPLTANLLVADETRSDKTICLAVSPSLKAMSVPSRPNIEEYREWGQSEPGYRNDQKTLRRAGDHTDRVFRHRGVQGSGAGDPVTLPTILGFAGTIRHQETSYFRG